MNNGTLVISVLILMTLSYIAYNMYQERKAAEEAALAAEAARRNLNFLEDYYYPWGYGFVPYYWGNYGGRRFGRGGHRGGRRRRR